MCRVAISDLTQGYFTRWFCRLEASVARALNKPLVVLFESDPRHHGHSDYVQLARQATHKYPQYLSWLLDTEAIPMARRGYARRVSVAMAPAARPRSPGPPPACPHPACSTPPGALGA
jgi:hypothetical protein